jgi:hypothetical protein
MNGGRRWRAATICPVASIGRPGPDRENLSQEVAVSGLSRIERYLDMITRGARTGRRATRRLSVKVL